MDKKILWVIVCLAISHAGLAQKATTKKAMSLQKDKIQRLEPDVFDTSAGLKHLNHDFLLGILKQDRMPCLIPDTKSNMPIAGQTNRLEQTMPNVWKKDSVASGKKTPDKVH
ncbi:MAG: hypothetical protein QM727_02040 [Niabella sp.]